MVEDKREAGSIDFSFPTLPERLQAVPSSARGISQVPSPRNPVDSADSRVAADGDIVDTNWDIPMIEFPTSDNAESRARGLNFKRNVQMHADGRERHFDLDFTPLPESDRADTQDAENAQDERASQEITDDAISTAQNDFRHVIAGPNTDNEEDSSTVVSVAEHAAQGGVNSASNRSWTIIGLAIFTVIALTVAGLLVWTNHSRSLRNEAIGECVAAVNRYNRADQALSKELHDSNQIQAITPEQVMDASSVTVLQSAVNEAKNLQRHDVTPSCDLSLSLDQLKSHTNTARSMVPAMQVATHKVSDATKSVTDSKAQKDAKIAADISSARNKLSQAIANSQQLLNDSRYQVADNATRITLQIAIETANTLMTQDKPDIAKIQQSLSDLQSASDAVNSSEAALTAQNRAQTIPQQRVQTTPLLPAPGASTNVEAPGDTRSQSTNQGQHGDGDTSKPNVSTSSGVPESSPSDSADIGSN